jgi:hypothetical protein
MNIFRRHRIRNCWSLLQSCATLCVWTQAA